MKSLNSHSNQLERKDSQKRKVVRLAAALPCKTAYIGGCADVRQLGDLKKTLPASGVVTALYHI